MGQKKDGGRWAAVDAATPAPSTRCRAAPELRRERDAGGSLALGARMRVAWPGVHVLVAITRAAPSPLVRRLPLGARRQSAAARGRALTALGTRSDATDEPYDLAENPEVLLTFPDHDGRHGRMLRPQQNGMPFAREPLDRRLTVDERDDDVARMGMVLAAHQDEVPLDDVGVDHAFPAHPEAEHVVAPATDPRGIERQGALAVLLRQKGRAGGDATQDRHLVRGRGLGRERERSRGPPFRAAAAK